MKNIEGRRKRLDDRGAEGPERTTGGRSARVPKGWALGRGALSPDRVFNVQICFGRLKRKILSCKRPIIGCVATEAHTSCPF